MRLAIVAEGESELGGRGNAAAPDGASITLVRRILGARASDPLDLLPIKLSGADLRRPDRPRQRGEAETAQLALEEALRRDCDGLVLFRDADRETGVRRADNLLGLARGAASATRPVPAVLGLQINTLEAWLLSDAGAFERAFGRPRPDLPRRPEELWGDRRDPTSNHPKQIFRRFLSLLALEGGRHTMAALVEHADLAVIADQCPDGFGRFRADFDRAFRGFSCVVAADEVNGIGKGNDLPWGPLRADLKHFRDITTTAPAGKRNAVIMGRRTWESVPPKYRPLAGRLNIVITRGEIEAPGGVVVARALDDALNRATVEPDIDAVFVIGGGQIYRQAFAHVRCHAVYLTRVEAILDCDTFIPDLNERFRLAEPMAGGLRDAGLDYRIERWVRQRPGT